MSNTVLSRTFRGPRPSFAPSLLYPSLYAYRAASLTRAIGRGIRRSQAAGFKGKPRIDPQDHAPRDGPIIRRSADPPAGALPKVPITHRGWTGKEEENVAPRSEPVSRSPTPGSRHGSTPLRPGPKSQKTPSKPLKGETKAPTPFTKPLRLRKMEYQEPLSIRIGKKLLINGKEVDPSNQPRNELERGFGGGPKRGYGSEYEPVRANNGRQNGGGRPWEHRGKADPAERRKFEREGPDYGRSSPASEREPRPSSNTRGYHGRQSWEPAGGSNSRSDVEYNAMSASRPYQNSNHATADRKSLVRRSDGEESQDWPTSRQDIFTTSQRDDSKPPGPPRVKRSMDKHIPLSIPYTTPASEFLYGTSVVEAALKSKRDLRRKHYKLYIYTGENRENAQQDLDLERLARRSGVEVSRVGADWLPMLDKMSGSRPHNGYILEASPLPRLPVTSLKKLAEQDGVPGFKVVVDYQTREDAAINGTSHFVSITKDPSARKPLVLFVDSILDPGNLGGIIRTASFLGASAIAISKNCTSFSPVVLKASAGASENIPILTVNKPAGFIADSKLAGWKVYAAVAPTTGSYDASLTFTDDLADPLSEDPCILMLGSEGEGLRKNLRAKANVELSIRGSRQSHSVDSLNVSVATGILCNAFLRKGAGRKIPTTSPVRLESDAEEDEKPVRVRELF